ncbi:hypothetical protein [Corynebacterium glyciniphilum]|uniref:hypothetical protein n=1 Tax=Corynebacterium glyciniphilum TaxID=1404244 RepID=UPI003DA17160
MAELKWNGDRITKAVHTAGQRGVRLAGEHLRTVAVSRTPIMTGHLQNSAKVQPDGENKVHVSYHTDYAAKQHEELGYQHKDGQAKFLESAMTSERAKLTAIIAAQIRGAL